MRPEWLGRSLVIQRQQFTLRGVLMNGRTNNIVIRAVGGTLHVTSAANVQRAFLVKAGG